MKKKISLLLILSILFSLSHFVFADVEKQNGALKIYLNSLIEVLYNKKQEDISNYTEIDSVLREYLKTDVGIDFLSQDAEKAIELIGNGDKEKLLNELNQNKATLETMKTEILNLKQWKETDRYAILDMIKNGQDISSTKLELENLIDKYNKQINDSNNTGIKDIGKHWAKDYILFMMDKKIANGYANGTFKPDAKITRAEFAKLLVETLKLEKVSYANSFSDVKTHWAKDYIQTAFNAELIKGYNNTFKPDAYITRAEMTTMIGRTLTTDLKADLTGFKDYNKIPAWAKDSVSKAVAEMLIKGDNNNFRPNDNTTRAEAITILYRLIQE